MDIERGYIETQEIAAVPLDALVKDLPTPYLIKIDAEGAELDVLKGAEQALRDAAAVIVEASVLQRYETGPNLAEVVCYMQERGFAVYDMVEGTIEDGRLVMVDLIFVPADAPFRKL